MKNKILIISSIIFSGFAFAQVGINENSPSAALDIKSKGNTGATKALEINNSGGTEMVTVLDRRPLQTERGDSEIFSQV